MADATKTNPVHYLGDSMHGTFVPGEMLCLRETPFDSLRPGDVTVIFDCVPHIVHRVIEKTPDFAVTMGDNNDRPDIRRLTRQSRFQIVDGVTCPNGAFRPVAGGKDGMRQFRRQQRKRRLYRLGAWLLRPLKPLKILRIPAHRETRFRNGTVQWSFAGIPVAARDSNGKTVYQQWWKRLFFRVPPAPPASAPPREKVQS